MKCFDWLDYGVSSRFDHTTWGSVQQEVILSVVDVDHCAWHNLEINAIQVFGKVWNALRFLGGLCHQTREFLNLGTSNQNQRRWAPCKLYVKTSSDRPLFWLRVFLNSWNYLSDIYHPARRALNSDWCINSFTMVVYTKIIFSFKKNSHTQPL